MILVMASDYDNLKEELPECVKAKEENIRGTKVYKVQIYDKDVLFVNSGITKVDFTRNFVNVIEKYPVTKVIGIGNAASLDDCLKIGEVGICSNSLQYDVDFTKLGYKIAEIPQLNKSIFYSDNELVKIAKEASEKECIEYAVGRTISADRFVSNTKETEELKDCFEANVLDTECGILGELSYLYNIPTVTVKGICNYGNNCAVEDYKKYRCMANQKALKIALTMIEMLSKKKCDSYCEYEEKVEKCKVKNALVYFQKECMSCNINIKDYKEMDECENIETIKRSKYTSLGMSYNDKPYIVPMCFEFIEKCNTIKLYSPEKGKKMTTMENNDNVVLSFTTDTNKGYKTVLVYGKAKIKDEYVCKMCNDCLVEIDVKVEKMVGKEYYYC